MNRKDRRAQNASGTKLARDATPSDIFPANHGPVQSNLVDVMKSAVDGLRAALGSNFHITLFVAERSPSDGTDRLPRFNYMSTAARADMLSVCKAFIETNAAVAPKLDKINDEPPTGTPQ